MTEDTAPDETRDGEGDEPNQGIDPSTLTMREYIAWRRGQDYPMSQAALATLSPADYMKARREGVT